MVEENFGRRREGGFRGREPPKPVKIGEEYEVDITETSQRGDGIARIEGLVVFVPGVKNGDHLRIKIARISRKFAEAEAVQKGDQPVPPEDKTPL
jgi:predicted RNA-binding protein with TRAM domain